MITSARATSMNSRSPISPAETGATTTDRLLDGRVILIQPARGSRAAIDPVVLAAAVPASAGERVLELGCGTGAAALCLAARVPGCRVSGIDVQTDLIALARQGAVASGLEDVVSFEVGDILDLPAAIRAEHFDHVMANPPHQRAGGGRVSPDRAKALAHVEGATDLGAWVRAALAHVKSGGTVTFVHRADRAGEVAALLAAAGGDTIVFPLWPKRQGQAAKRALIQARLRGDGRVRQGRGLVLHRLDGAFSADAEALLRQAQALAIFAA